MKSIFFKGWYVVYTRPKHEKKVANCLEERKIPFFLPTIKIIRQWCDRKKLVETPLFPSYVFVFLNEMKNYYDTIRNNEGVLYFVKQGERNARVQDTVIENIQTLVNRCDDIESTNEYFEPGHEITIKGGPFVGLHGQVVRHNSRHKILVRIDLLNRNILATIPVEYIYN